MLIFYLKKSFAIKKITKNIGFKISKHEKKLKIYYTFFLINVFNWTGVWD